MQTSEWLKEKQREILDSLIVSIQDKNSVLTPSGPAPKVAAIVGPRGFGKSTLLAQLRQHLLQLGPQERSGGWFVNTRILDAAVVRRDLGLAAAVIEELARTGLFPDRKGESFEPSSGVSAGPRFQPGRSGGGEIGDPTYRGLQESFKLCLESALMQEESYRQIAQELAMTPGHYAKIVAEQSERRQQIAAGFDSFMRDLSAVLRAREKVDPQTKPRFVVLLDDLDLAEAKSVRRWVRALLAHYAHEDVCYVLSFDRDYLVRALSRESRAPNARKEIDLVSGRALLSKLVPPHQQFELRYWTFEERRSFQGLRVGPDGQRLVAETEDLVSLLQGRGVAHLLPLLPGRPRSLEGVYRWLKGLSKEEGVKLDEILRQIALAAGEDDLLRELDQQSAARFASRLNWEEAATLNDETWISMMRAARSQEPIWGMPVPPRLREMVRGNEPEAFLEALLDSALQKEVVTPYQLLNRMPFIQSRLKWLSCSLSWIEADVLRYFSQEEPVSAKKSVVTNALPWQDWAEKAAEQSWKVEIGPPAMWKTYHDFRSPAPAALLRALFLPRLQPDPVGDQKDILPQRCRPLLLLIDNLLRAPWPVLEARLSFWNPLTFTRCVAAFTLGAYVRGSQDPADSVPWLLKQAWSEPEIGFFDRTEEDIQEQFNLLLDHLESRDTASSQDVVQAELLRSLQVLLEQPCVKGLR